MPLIRDQLAAIFHMEGQAPGKIHRAVAKAFGDYKKTLSHASQSLLDRSVGTSCWVFLLMAGAGDPLFLQVKEARASVLERSIAPCLPR
jgi:hypothetical protein